MSKHIGKLIAPIAIIAVVVAWYASIAWLGLEFVSPWWGKAAAVIVPLVFIGLGIYVLVQRINEIRSGEEDDLSKY